MNAPSLRESRRAGLMTDSAAEATERWREARRAASLHPAAAGSGRRRAAPSGRGAAAPMARATESGQREAPLARATVPPTGATAAARARAGAGRGAKGKRSPGATPARLSTPSHPVGAL